MKNQCPFRLIYQFKGQEPKEVPLDHGEYIIGRSSQSDIVLAGMDISRKHVRLNILPDGEIWITDLGSANGTQVDGKPLSPRRVSRLELDKRIVIGGYQLFIQSLESKPAPIETLVEDVSESPTSVDGIMTEIEEGEPAGPPTDMTEGVIIPSAVAAAAPPPSKPKSEIEQILQVQILKGNIVTQTTPLKEGTWQIGREKDCDVQISDPFISRHHMEIQMVGTKITITDKKSSNGVNVNGKKILPGQPVVVSPSDKIEIGEFGIHLSLVMESEAQAAKAPCMDTTPLLPDEEEEKELSGISKPLNLMGLEKVNIGRAPDNHIIIKHPMVSRYHAIIERMGTRYRIIDMNSANGVFVNEEKIDKMGWLKPSDQIKIGPYEFNFTGTIIQQSSAEGYTIDVLNLKKYVTKTLNLLQEISLHIEQNEFIALVGMSGAGKTTLQDAINGYRPATHGEVLINGVDLYKNYDMFRNDIGYVPQRDIVHMELTPQASLDYCAKLRMPVDTTEKERQEAIKQTLGDLGLLERKEVQNARLSGGQLKRVSIGVELLTRPKLFFLDEPTSGLDPGTEYEMMKLLRRLADQGRTIMLITHATKNVMLCDKVIIMATGGYLAYYGPPEEALKFFDKYRTPKERLEKDMEFDDIYRILEDFERGTPEEWNRRYEEEMRIRPVAKPPIKKQAPQQASKRQKTQIKRVSALKQFFILSSRNTKILIQDKVSLMLLILLAPLLGFMNFIWGPNLFDPEIGSVRNIMSMWFMTAVIGILVGTLSSVREIVKELDIYKRERAVGLKILPYVLSKLWIGGILSIYAGATILFFVIVLVKPEVISILSYGSFFITIILCIFSGYLLGLLISAVVPNQNAALTMLIAVLVPQLLFSGVLIPLETVPFGVEISSFITTRWSYEGFVRSTGMGDPISSDLCWQLDPEARKELTEAEKESCTCLGANIFETCRTIPGILSSDFYNDEAQVALAMAEPQKPVEPTAIPSPTSIASPTPFPSPTANPSPTPLPTPQMGPNMDMQAFIDEVGVQKQEYFDERIDQLDQYQQDVKDQTSDWADLQSDQMEVYADESAEQYEVYADDMEVYGEVLADWEKDRQTAIGAAESVLTAIFDDYGRAFKGTALARWFNLGLICFGMFILILIFQRRKDVV